MLSVLKTEDQISRLEKSGRLLRRPFADKIWQVAALDLGDSLKYLRPEDAAAQGLNSIEACWAEVTRGFQSLLPEMSLLGSEPFWFLDCPGWAPSALLAWPGLRAWIERYLSADRPLIAASFTAEQLIIGFADSAEFHDRLGHARIVPMESPLLPLPFLLTETGPEAVQHIELALGEEAVLTLASKDAAPQRFPLQLP